MRLIAPRAAYDALQPHYDAIGIEHAGEGFRWPVFNALTHPYSLDPLNNIDVELALAEVGPGWRQELLQIAQGKDISNQGVGEGRILYYQNLRFRSDGEISIAKALDMMGITYLPNCRARVGFRDDRKTREADFLICDRGRWGILEVDSQTYHTPQTRTSEQERDRLFHKHGIKVIQHYTHKRCIEAPIEAVKEFLELLRQP